MIEDEFNDIDDTKYNTILNEQRPFDKIFKTDKNIKNTIYYYDGVYSKHANSLPSNFESNNDLEKSLPKIRDAFVKKKIYLPQKSYDNELINVCCHIKLNDSVKQYVLDINNLINCITQFQKNNKYRVIIHADIDISHLECENTIIYDSNTHVLQALSDFIHADILIITDSSLSIAAHLLADNTQNVICPTQIRPVMKYRLLPKCAPYAYKGK